MWHNGAGPLREQISMEHWPCTWFLLFSSPTYSTAVIFAGWRPTNAGGWYTKGIL